MLKGIKSVIFDLGGVIYGVDYHKTINAFKALGVDRFEEVYAKAGQSDLFNDLEEGKISRAVFVERIKTLSGQDMISSQIFIAWNSMLLGFMPDALTCLKRLSGSYRLFLLSNTNEIHIQEIESRVGAEVFSDFCALFEKVYLSHELGVRKPHPEVFIHIIEEQGLAASETLFIDDSIQHVEGAIKAGLRAYHLTDDQTIDQLFP
ncbi:MAG: HAD family phosphatase [Flavobacteriales bacterium]|nr:HAD family phosphatase [Flavobacteriales bacterium]